MNIGDDEIMQLLVSYGKIEVGKTIDIKLMK